ncbi:Mu transposase C-terminal domain-containing protein [Microbacterium sp. W1N]|uniref:Mu transposase C-terminal domain-containing protein n=1 Tax=Microbacterium festucae TaxID=2977531 RepID=UPI0021BE1EE5|nr:Mu transposase C-terminal domain-containing protein [Microbacterium festucae]MCT9819297.1 Mu transposase C-terminal domain-containing protein [Microbacterium festucae]
MNAPRAVSIGQTVELGDDVFSLVGYDRGVYSLRNEYTDDYIQLSHIELARRLPRGRALETVEPERTVAETLADLKPEMVALLPHLRELLDGTPLEGGERRTKYGAKVPINEKLGAKELELEKLHMPVPFGTLKRKYYAFKARGIDGLTDRRAGRKNVANRTDEDVVSLIREVVATYEGQSTTSYAAIRAKLKKRLMEEYPDASQRPTAPSISTVERYVKAISGDLDPTRSAKQRETKSLSPKRAHRPRRVMAPGEECQADTTRFDARVLMPDGSIRRPYLTILTDKATRSILSFYFSVDAPTATDHAALIARALVPRQLRPWSTDYDELGLAELPWAKYLSVDDPNQWDTHRPWIFPSRIIIDNGQDYRGEVVLMTCERYGITLTQSPPHSPTSKAHVERTFGSISSKFARYLPQYVGGKSDDRGAKLDDSAPLDLRTVADLFDRWVAVVWQNRQHDGLVDPWRTSVRHTPNTMYSAAIEFSGHHPVPLLEDDYIALLPFEPRTVQAKGITLGARTYDSPHLGPLRLNKTPEGKAAMRNVHFDPSDYSQVWVRSPLDGEWITCAWTEEAGLSRPHLPALMAAAADLAAVKPGFTNEEADDLLIRFQGEAVINAATRKRAEIEATRAALKSTATGVSTDALVTALEARSTGASFDEFDDLDTF